MTFSNVSIHPNGIKTSIEYSFAEICPILQRVGGHESTIMLVEDSWGYVFGAFIETAWPRHLSNEWLYLRT